jgi:uncharacterized protein
MAITLSLKVLSPDFAIVQRAADDGIPWWAARSETFLSFTRTSEESSLVCESRLVPEGVQAQRGYRALRIDGPLALDATGILASLAVPLAGAGVPIFVIATFDTDYILVPEAKLSAAIKVLQGAGHRVTQ